ncbi:hypothetical protein C1645_826039 [Glomus cerebriforme]|uniref:Uncharacterized protein n=1 Tax=Glomus cerebriforme TaxID=658196 RepID=A0A397T0Q8_9GLOM|nr:hypothetical protein C1645_826039 [Glomus cerebriforme]
MLPKTRLSIQRGRGRDSTPKNISSRRPVDDVSSSDEQIAKDTYGPTKRTKTNDLKPMNDIEKVSAAEHSSSSDVPVQTSSSSSSVAATEVSPTSASTTPVTTPIVNKGKGRAEGPETVDDSIHTSPNSSSNSSSALLPPPEDDTDPPLTIPVTSEIFAAAAAPTEALLKQFPQKSMLKNEVDSFFGSDPLYKGSSIVGAKDDLHIIIRFYSEDSLKNSIGSPIADLHDVIFHLYDHNADRATEADRTLLLSDIPLDIKPSHLKSCLAHFGLVKKLTLRTPPTLYGKKPLLSLITKKRSTPFTIYGPSRVWATVLCQPWSLPADANRLRHSFTIILAGLSTSFDVKAGDLHSIWTKTKARSINIPRSRFSYRPKPYAHVTFPSQETMDAAMELSFQFNDRSLTWYHSSDAKDLCLRCGFKYSSEGSNCAKSSRNRRSTDKNVQRLYNKYKPAQHRNDSQKSRASSRSRSHPRSRSKVRISAPNSSQSYASAVKQLASGSSSSSSSSPRKISHFQRNNRDQPYQDPTFQSRQDDYSELPSAEAFMRLRERISEVESRINTLVTYIENFELRLFRLEKAAGAATADYNNEWDITQLHSSEFHTDAPHLDKDITMSSVSNNAASQSSSSIIDPAIPTSSSDTPHATPVSTLINISDAELLANPSASLASTIHQMLNPIVNSLKSIKAQQDVIEKQQRSLPSSAPSQDSQ